MRSVVRRFGLVAAAGEVATAYGVLPWSRGEATRAAKVCFQAWLEERGGTQAAEDREAIEQVRTFIEEHGDSRFALLGTPNGEGENAQTRTNYRAGFRRFMEEGGTEYLFLPGAWKKEVCKGIDPKRAAQALRNAGYLRVGSEARMTQVIKRHLPEKGTFRAYVVDACIMGAAE